MRLKNNIFIICLFLCGIAQSQSNDVRKEYSQDIAFELKNFDLQPIQINNQTFYTIDTEEGFSKSTDVGQALLPVQNQILSLPADSEIQTSFSVIEKDTVYIQDDILLCPLQPSQIKKDTFYNFCFDKAYYSTDEFQGDGFVSVSHVGNIKEEQLVVIKISPFRYNPVLNAIERIKKANIRLDVKSKATAFVDKQSNRLLILTDEAFCQSLIPFVKWKNKQGFPVTLITTAQTGKTTAQIKSYLSDLYYSATALTPAFDYLLIVGDTSWVPTFKGKYKIEDYPAHYTDLYYAEYTSDILPDMCYGRISVSDTQTLNHIIKKIVDYEQGKFVNDNYLGNSLLVAGKENGDNAPTFTNGQNNYAKQYLQSLTDTSVFYNPSSADQSNKQAINNRLSMGNSWINYSGHGSSSGWQNPPFRIKDIDTLLNNTDKYGIFINNCCHSGKYDEQVCFTEALLQAESKGAVAAIGSSDYTLWDEDYYFAVGSKNPSLSPVYDSKKLGIYDRFFHTHNEPVSLHATTMGQILQAGCLAVTQSLSSYYFHYWEMYNLQGDPTMIPFVGTPQQIQNNLPDSLILGTGSWELQTIPYALVGLSCNDSFIVSQYADSSGIVIFDLSDITSEKTIDIVISSQFHKPLIDSVKVVAPSTEFLALENIKIFEIGSDEEVKNLTAGGQYCVSFEIANNGKKDVLTGNNRVEFFSENNLLIAENSKFFSVLNSGERLYVENAFNFKVKDGVKNLDIAQLVFAIYTNDKKINEQKLLKEIFAPQIAIISSSMSIKDSLITLAVCLQNSGKQTVGEGSVVIYNIDDDLMVENTVNTVKSLASNQIDTVFFYIENHNPQIKNLTFDLTYTAGAYTAEKAYNIDLQPQTEGFENGFATFVWQNDDDNPWFIDSSKAHSGKYSARSKKNLADNKKSRLNIITNNDVSSTVSFYAKVSSEDKYDFFIFYIDQEPKLSLTFGEDGFGNELDWQQYSFEIPDGTHTLCFSYEKDQSTAFKEDCAWIDDIAMTVGTNTILFALDNINQNDVVLYPNPAKQTVCLENLPYRSDIVVIDNLGRIVYYAQTQQKTYKIDTDNWKNGVYLVEVKTNGHIVAKKKLIVTK